MKRSGVLLIAIASASMAADQPSPAELKMREALRNTMLQLRAAETERANLQATQAEFEQKNKILGDQVEALGKQLAADKAKADKIIAEQVHKLAKQEADSNQLKETLQRWKSAHAQVTELAREKEAARAALEGKAIALQRRVEDQQRKNDAMYRLGTEVLKRYERFGLGDAFTAREPFVGTTRVKFENLIQDYSDKLSDARIKPEPAPQLLREPAPRVEERPTEKSGRDKSPSSRSKGKRERVS